MEGLVSAGLGDVAFVNLGHTLTKVLHTIGQRESQCSMLNVIALHDLVVYDA